MTAQPSRMQSVFDRIDPQRAAALHATLDCPGPPPGPGDALPGFWHQAYFWHAAPTSQLAHDGHEQTGGEALIPDLGLPQRMWAAGRLAFHAPLRIGEEARKITRLESVTEKQGRTGRLGFVTLRHEVTQDGGPCLTEWQDIVYRDPPEGRRIAEPPRARTDETERLTLRLPTALLFRYSALTFNAHRIHYDLDYCREEGHPGLVVHGPLLAQLLIAAAEDALGDLAAFSFRATSALYHSEEAELCRSGTTLWIRGPDGRQCTLGEATPV